MGKIADTVYKELNYMYCDNCRYNSEIKNTANCDDCHRKYNGWAVSRQIAERIEKLCQEEKPQGEWICPNCDLYKQVENDYCQYAGECTIGCRKCKYFEQKGGSAMRKPNCVTCDHFGKCDGCEKGEEE